MKSRFAILIVGMLMSLMSDCMGQGPVSPNSQTTTITVLPGRRNVNTSVTLAHPTLQGTDGLSVDIHPPLMISPGYAKWKIIVSRTDGLPFSADGELEFRIRHTQDNTGFTSVHSLKMEQGRLTAEDSLLVSKWSRATVWSCQVFRDGKELKGLRTEDQHTGMRFQNAAGSRSLAIGLEEDFDNADYLDKNPEPLETFVRECRDVEQWEVGMSDWSPTLGLGTDQWSFGFETRMPDHWLDYARFSWVWIPERASAKLNDAQCKALRQYVQGGGIVIILDSPEDASSQLAKRISGDESFDWSGLSPASYSGAIKTREAKLGFGMLVATDYPTLPRDQNSLQQLESRYAGHVYWGYLRGITEYMEGGKNYWNWTIRGVGESPVAMFILVVVGFAGVAGPGVYWWCNRRNRSGWIMLLFPAISFVSTLIVVGYAFFCDGVGSLARIRSNTWYDAKADEGFVWSRQTYFSSSPSSSGLSYPLDTEVYPVNRENRYGSGATNATSINGGLVANETMVRSSDRQTLLQFLRPREQGQLMIRQPISGLSPFKVHEGPQFQVENLMNESWTYACFVDEQSKFHWGENIPAKSTAKLEPCSRATLLERMGKLEEGNFPAFPRGMSEAHMAFLQTPYTSPGLMSVNKLPLMESTVTSPTASSFYIYLPEAKYVPRGMKAREIGSFHVISGKW